MAAIMLKIQDGRQIMEFHLKIVRIDLTMSHLNSIEVILSVTCQYGTADIQR